MMGQDSETAAEFVMTVRTEHVAMKTWYNNPDIHNNAVIKNLKDKYGDYPALWKEVLNWPGWKETRKEYLKFQQTNEMTNSEDNGYKSKTPNLTDTGCQSEMKDHSDQGQSTTTGATRKRKSRWGTATTSGDNANGSNDPDSKRQSRWGRDDQQPNGQQQSLTAETVKVPSVPLMPPLLLPGLLPGTNGISTVQLTPQQQQEMEELRSRLRVVNEKLEKVDSEAERIDALPRSNPERSPSPPPIYGPDGKRKNTRAVRWREKYTKERQDILEKLLQLNPTTRKGSNNLFFRKRTNKIRIPVEKHPTYNFIGLIIGPRGKTQKELEAKTGCKIAIRGKGSVKEGARGRRDGQVMMGDNDPLHVVITGDDQASVDAASSMIEQMLIVIDDEKNVHKQQQLRELALLNGTLKDEDIYCTICAEKGHRSFECPKQFAHKKGNSNILQVKCAICGDTSHPTRDCRKARQPSTNVGNNTNTTLTQPRDSEEMDSDYLSFMAEIEGKRIDKPATFFTPLTQSDGMSSAPSSNLPSIELPPVPIGNVVPPASLPPPPASLPLPPSTSLPPLPPSTFPPPTQPLPTTASLPPPPTTALPTPLGTLPALLPPMNNMTNNYYGVNGSGNVGLQAFPPPQPTGINRNGYQQGDGYQRQHNNSSGGYDEGYQQHQSTYQSQQQYYSNPPHQYQQQQYLSNDHQQQQFPNPSQQQVRPGEETTAWDPNAYYGSGGGGELNWWEQ